MFNSLSSFVGMIAYFYSQYPIRTLLTISSLFLGNLLEGFGVALLLPIMASLFGQSDDESLLTKIVESLFGQLGLSVSLSSLLIFFVFFIFLKFFVTFTAMREVGKTASMVTAELRQQFVSSVLRANWSYIAELPAGRAGNALSSEAERAALSYLVLCVIISDITLVFVYLTIAMFVSWPVSFAAIFCGIILFVMMRGVMSGTKVSGDAHTKHMNTMLSKLSDSLNVLKPIKCMAMENAYIANLTHDIDALKLSQQSRFTNREFIRLVREPAIILFLSLGLFIGIEVWNIGVAYLMVLSALFMRMAMKLMNVQTGYNQFLDHQSGFWSLIDLIDHTNKQQETRLGTVAPSFSNRIIYKNVIFRFNNAATVLNGIDITILPSKLYALIGASGSGKTTLIDLLLGLHLPNSGEIKIDQNNINDIDIRKWRKLIGYVPQDCLLMKGSIYENVSFGRSGITEEDVISALKLARAWDFTNSLDNGIWSNVGEKGLALSGGQRQRVAIARALVGNPSLLILDEPTSALDNNTEKELFSTLKELSKTITVIVISHSSEVGEYADQVYHLSKGGLE